MSGVLGKSSSVVWSSLLANDSGLVAEKIHLVLLTQSYFFVVVYWQQYAIVWLFYWRNSRLLADGRGLVSH